MQINWTMFVQMSTMCDGMSTTFKSHKPNWKKIGAKWEKIENAALVRNNLWYGVPLLLHFEMNYERVLFVQIHIPGMLHFMCCHLKIALCFIHQHQVCPYPHSHSHPRLYQLVRICDFPLCADKRCLRSLYSQFPLWFSGSNIESEWLSMNNKHGKCRRWKCNCAVLRFE